VKAKCHIKNASLISTHCIRCTTHSKVYNAEIMS